MPVKIDVPVVRVGEWQRLQPMALKSAAPFKVDWVEAAGVGAAERRLNAAKFTISDDISDSVPKLVPKFGLLAFWFNRLVESSGDPLNTHPVTALRSLGKFSFDTPCSTLYASPTKISSDLFCAFQPNRVMVPSLPLVLKTPPIFNDARADCVAARLACKLASGVASTRPRPNSGVGVRKITLLLESALAKSGCASVQPGASERPVIV